MSLCSVELCISRAPCQTVVPLLAIKTLGCSPFDGNAGPTPAFTCFLNTDVTPYYPTISCLCVPSSGIRTVGQNPMTYAGSTAKYRCNINHGGFSAGNSSQYARTVLPNQLTIDPSHLCFPLVPLQYKHIVQARRFSVIPLVRMMTSPAFRSSILNRDPRMIHPVYKF